MATRKDDHRPDPPTDSTDEQKTDRYQVSRRGFLKGVGGGAVTAAVVKPTAAKAQEMMPKGVSAASITLNVNGETRVVPNVEARATLLDVLRNRLDLTGAKPVCQRASCGGCTVMVDGKTGYSCSMLAMDSEGRHITTVEGLAKGDTLHPVQEAFVEHDALMCGFCTPGFVVSVASLLEHNQDPSLDEIKHAISGNICRCGTYTRIFEAAQTAAKKMRGGM